MNNTCMCETNLEYINIFMVTIIYNYKLYISHKNLESIIIVLVMENRRQCQINSIKILL